MNLNELIGEAPYTLSIDLDTAEPEALQAAKADINTYCNLVADWCNEKVHPAPVASSDVIRYLTVAQKIRGIREAAQAGGTDQAVCAREFLQALEDFESFDLQNATYLALVSAHLLKMEDMGLITQDDRAVILMLGDNQRSRAQVAGIGEVTARSVYVALTAARLARENAARDEANKAGSV